MAIDPSAEYPGQIITGLPGYPLGKAVNVAVSGDGTGTPLEAKWVSDLFGWEQALLDAAGITPSGDPDAVGASDYLDALDALYPAIGRMATAESDINALEASRVTGPASATDEAFARFDLTTGKLLQDGVVKATDAGAVTGVTSLVMGGALSGVTTLALSGATTGGTNVTISGELSYASGKTRYMDLPLPRQAANWSGGAGADLVATTLNSFAYIPFFLPVNCTVTAIDIIVTPASGRTGTDRMIASLEIRRQDYNSPFGLSMFSTMDTFGGTGTSKEKIAGAGAYAVGTDATKTDRLCVSVRSGIGGSVGDIVHAVRVTFTDPGPRNA